MGKWREGEEMNHSESKHIFEMQLRLEFQAAVCLSGNALVQEAVDISIIAFIWRMYAAGKKRTSFG